MIDEARTKGVKVHFASLIDICQLKNAQLEKKNQKYKGRVVLRGDIVKDDSGAYAVFTEQGSSASQMTAAKVMDTISRLPGWNGQAADAVCLYPFTATLQFGAQIYSCASSNENSRCKSSSGQGLGKLEKNSAWKLTKVRSKKEVIDEARTKGAKVHFASPMDICHLQNAELETKHQKKRGRVVLQGDTVKDDSGCFAVFTEQGS